MAMPVIGVDCDIMLCHPDVNSGDPYGFILTPDPTHGRSGVSIQREVQPDSNTSNIYLFFSVMIADDLINPDGSEHANSRSVIYSMLLDFLAQSSQIALTSVLGTWLGIGTIGHSATELHLVKGSILSVKLANVSEYRPPAVSALVFGSLWHGSPPAAGAFTWETSIWR